MANYVSNKDLTAELIKSKEIGELTPEAIRMLMLMIKQINRPLRYKFPMDRDDCTSEAIYVVLRRWKRFDANHPNANAFSYFTLMIKNGLAKGYIELHDIKTVNKVSINDQSGVYNI